MPTYMFEHAKTLKNMHGWAYRAKIRKHIPTCVYIQLPSEGVVLVRVVMSHSFSYSALTVSDVISEV